MKIIEYIKLGASSRQSTAKPASSININRRRRGFTIVELLVVIAVIAILASISIVVYTNIQSRAHDSAVQADLRQFAQLMELELLERGHQVLGDQSALEGAIASVGESLTFNRSAVHAGESPQVCQSGVADSLYWTLPLRSASGTWYMVGTATSTPMSAEQLRERFGERVPGYVAAYEHGYIECSGSNWEVALRDHRSGEWGYGF